jgi:hypothetical protein
MSRARRQKPTGPERPEMRSGVSRHNPTETVRAHHEAVINSSQTSHKKFIFPTSLKNPPVANKIF